MLKPLAAFAALLLAACSTDGPPATPSKLVKTPALPPSFASAEEDAILQVVDSFLLAVGNHDQSPNGEVGPKSRSPYRIQSKQQDSANAKNLREFRAADL